MTTTNFTDTNTIAGTIYYYLVFAASTCNQSGHSDFVAANVIDTTLPPVWNGGSLTGDNWSDAANWNGIGIAPTNTLAFDGANRLDNFNDTAANSFYSGITFNPGAGAFVLNGNPITLGGNIANNSPLPQVINLGLNFRSSISFNGASNSLFIASGLTNTLGTPGSTTLTLAGSGTLVNLPASANNPGGTNIVVTTGNANWSLLDNSSSAPASVSWVFSINSGTFSFGSASSAPNLTTTTPNNLPSDNQAGTVSGATGTFNLLGGTLTTASRLNTATALNSTGIVNQAGGTFNLGSQFQGANGGNAGEISIVNLSEYEARWSVTSSTGEAIQSGTLNPMDCAPGKSCEVKIPAKKPPLGAPASGTVRSDKLPIRAVPEAGVPSGGEFRLRVSFHTKADLPWAKAGHEMAWQQMKLEVKAPAIPKTKAGDFLTLTVRETDNGVLVENTNFSVGFSRKSGTLDRYAFNSVPANWARGIDGGEFFALGGVQTLDGLQV